MINKYKMFQNPFTNQPHFHKQNCMLSTLLSPFDIAYNPYQKEQSITKQERFFV